MFTRIAHVCLNVKNLDRSVAYYQKLGFKPSFQFTRNGADFGAYLEIAPDNYIEMFEDPGMDAPVNTGIAHFCLESQDLDKTIAQLRANGVEFTEKKLGCDHTYQIWLRDPDGNAFEVHQYTDKSCQKTGGSIEADW